MTFYKQFQGESIKGAFMELIDWEKENLGKIRILKINSDKTRSVVAILYKKKKRPK